MALKEVQPTARRQFVSQTRTRALGVDTRQGDERLAIMSELSKFAQAGSAEANRQQRAEIETKKALGASRAAQDLLKTEEHRQGLTEDTVLAEKLAYNKIVGKHETMNAGNDFADWYQSNPSASDEEIEAKKTELYQPIFEKYGEDEHSLKQISLQVQESQFQLLGVQSQIKGQYTKAKNNEAFGISVSDLLADPNADIATMMDKELPARAKALGLSEFEMKKSIMKEASTRAAEGDNRLLEKLESEPWAKDSAVLKKARSDYDRFEAREQSPAIGDAMADIEIEMNSLVVPWETTLRKIESLNKQHPNTYSASRVAALKSQRAAAVTKAKQVTSGTQSSFKIYTDDKQVPLAQNPAYSDKNRKDIVKSLEAQWADKTKTLVDSGMSQDEVNDAILKDQLKWSRLNRVPIPSLQTNLNSAINLPLDEIQSSEELPSYATSSFKMLKTMDATAIELYLPSKKDTAFALNFQHFAQTMDDDAAYRRAAQMKRNPYNVAPDQREQQRGAVRTAVTEALDTDIWDSLNPFSEKVEVPSWQREQIVNRMTDEAEGSMFAGSFDTEANANQALKIYQANSTQLFNGTMTNQPQPLLASRIANGRPMDVNKTGDYIEAFTLTMKPFITKAYGTDVDMKDVSIEFSRDGSSFIMKYKGYEQLGGRHNTDDIYETGRNADMKRLRELNVSSEAQQEREADFKKAVEFDIERGYIPATPMA
ncbi:lysozyme domain-containing protein [Vibrio phage D530]